MKRKWKRIMVGVMMAGVVTTSVSGNPYMISEVSAAETSWDEIQTILSTVEGKQEAPIDKSLVVGDRIFSQGMLLGNGSLGVVSDARPNEQSYYLATGDAWDKDGKKITNSQLKFSSTIPEVTDPEPEPEIEHRIPKTTVSNEYAKESAGPEAVFDENTDTYWVSQKRSENQDPRIITFDFEQEVTIDKWRTTHRGYAGSSGEKYNTYEFALEKSVDGQDWEVVDSVTGNTEKDVVRTLDQVVTARYFRINVTRPVQPGAETYQIEGDRETTRIGEVDFLLKGQSIVHAPEAAAVEVPSAEMMEAAAVEVPSAETLEAEAQAAAVKAVPTFKYKSSDKLGSEADPILAFDNNEYTAWKSDTQVPTEERYDKKEVPKDKWVYLQCTSGHITFDTIEVKHSGVRYSDQEIYNTYDYEIQIAENGKDWTTLQAVTGNTENVNIFNLDTPVTTKYVRLYITKTVSPEYETKTSNKDMTSARIVDVNLYKDGVDVVNFEPEPTGDFLHEQDIVNAEVRSKVKFDENLLKFRSWTSDARNVLFTDVSLDENAGGEAKVYVELEAPEAFSKLKGVEENTLWLSRDNGNTSSNKYDCRMVTTARVIEGSSEILGNGIVLTLQPGETAKVATFAHSSSGFRNSPEYLKAKPLATVKEEALNYVNGIDINLIEKQYVEHLEWWKDYWTRSYIDIEEGLVKDYYYGALYAMGCSIRPTSAEAAQKNVPAAISGLWQTSDVTKFDGRGYCNYNYEAPYYGMPSSNRGDYLIPYFEEASVRVSMQQNALAKLGYQGSQITRSIQSTYNFYDKAAPIEPTGDKQPDKLPTDQKSNIMLYTMPLIWDWEYYRDDERLNTYIYDAITETVKFYMDFMVKGEDGKYWIYDSANNETEKGTPKDVNPILDMGYVKSHFTAFIEMSEYLNKNLDMIEPMKEILENMADLPTSETSESLKKIFEENGVELENEILVSAYETFNEIQKTTGNCAWGAYIYEGNQPVILEGLVHPGGIIHKNSDPEMVKLAQDTFNFLNPGKVHYRGASYNGFPKTFTIAARLGLDPERMYHEFEVILENIKRDNLTWENGHVLEFTGAIESINSMMLQNEGNEMEIFPSWPAGKIC